MSEGLKRHLDSMRAQLTTWATYDPPEGRLAERFEGLVAAVSAMEEALGRSPWAQGAVLTNDDYDRMRKMWANDGVWLVQGYGAGRHGMAELVRAGLVRGLGAMHSQSPGYELTRFGREWAERDTAPKDSP